MTAFQKVIKYLALAFAVFLIVNIISGILMAVNGLSTALGLRKKDEHSFDELNVLTSNIENKNIATLMIDLKYSNLRIQKSDVLKVETNSSSINCKQNNSQLIIKESDNGWLKNNKLNDLIVYVPENLNFEDINIKTGAGEVYIQELNAKNLHFEIGAGKVQIDSLNVLSKAEIEGGAGKVVISSGEINNLDLHMGIGQSIVNSKLTGRSKIEAGIGKISVNLLDDISNYTVKIDKGIGSIKINGKEMSDNEEHGSGRNYIDINGGIGAVEVNSDK